MNIDRGEPDEVDDQPENRDADAVDKKESSEHHFEPEFKLGEGKVSGVVSFFLGILSDLAVNQ